MASDAFRDSTTRDSWKSLAAACGYNSASVGGNTMQEVHPLQPDATLTVCFDEINRLIKAEATLHNLMIWLRNHTLLVSATPRFTSGLPSWQTDAYNEMRAGNFNSMFVQWMIRQIGYELDCQLSILFHAWIQKTTIPIGPGALIFPQPTKVLNPEPVDASKYIFD